MPVDIDKLTDFNMSRDIALTMPRCCDIDIEEVSIQQLQTYMSEDRIKGADLVQCYLKRIELVNTFTKSRYPFRVMRTAA